MTTTNKEPSGLSSYPCPFCEYVEYGDKYALFNHTTYFHIHKVVELIASRQEEMIPREKVQALIKATGLNDIDYKNNLGTYDSRAEYRILKELLKEDSK